MKTYCVTNHFLGSVRSLFPEAEVLPENYHGEKCDLLIFTGGTDVDPARYGSNFPAWEKPDLKRDQLEAQLVSDVRRGRFAAKKVLGICRGLQIINVALGGTLVGDIYSKFNESHSAVHPIEWVTENKMSAFLPRVNSMHHQGIERIGSRLNYRILGLEPSTKLIEAILWTQSGEEKILAVQFHPEFFSDSPEKTKFGELVRNWVNGEERILNQEPAKSVESRYNADFSFTVNWSPISTLDSEE